LEPVPDPLDIIKELVVKGTEDVEREVRDLRKIAGKELFKGSRKRMMLIETDIFLPLVSVKDKHHIEGLKAHRQA